MKHTFNQPDTFLPSYYEVRQCNGTLQSHVDTGDVLVTRCRGDASGRETPNYTKVLLEGGLLPLNYYSRWDYKMVRTGLKMTGTCCSGSPTSVFTTVNRLPAPYQLWDDVTDSPDIPNYWEGVNTDALIIAAMANIIPQLDVLTTAAEAHKTFNMVNDVREDAKKLIRNALRGGKHTAKAAADAWMAWRYGWQILGMDMANIYKFLMNPVGSLVLRGQSGESNRTDLTTIDEVGLSFSGGIQTLGTITTDVSLRARVNALWRAETLNAIANPLITGWELIPFSFVADWFVNVGDVLSAWQVALMAEQVQASLGSQFTIVGKCTSTPINGTCPDNSLSQTQTSECDETLIGRTRVPASIPQLVPSFTVNLTSKKITDLAAMCVKRIL